MSYTENAGSNPYVAPESQIAAGGPGVLTAYTGYSGFWRRFAAYFIDNIIMALAGGVLGGVIGGVIGASGRQVGPGVTVAIQLLSIVIAVAYYAGMESSTSQATLGKMAMGIKVTDLSGRRISFGRATGRFFAKILSGLILLIGFIMAAFTDKKQALHDMIAGTLVLKVR